MDPYLPGPAFAHKIALHELLLVERAGRTIGYVRLEYIWGKIPYIGLIWLEPTHRGQGIGRAVLAFVEAHLRERGYTFLLSSCQVNEPEPQAWHRAVGFRECGLIAGINDGGIGEVFFRKEL
ncbi:MAG: N-acetyltransferase [Symbiobacterium thermophilum]|nr:N-acetyltransferase [Symbiobacterium thermophilum]